MALFGKLFAWYKLWTPLGLLKLNSFRERMRKENLYDTETLPSLPHPTLPPASTQQQTTRTIDGTYNDIGTPRMGSTGARFGRNVPIDKIAIADPATLLTPSPREVSLQLMTRKTFQPATSLNLLAAAWLQFEIHDWFSHGSNEKDDEVEIQLKDDDTWPERPMKIRRTRRDPTRPPGDSNKTPSYSNTETHWWDGSQIYGSDLETQKLVRSFEGGRLKLGPDGLLPLGQNGIDVTGVNGNWWIGLALMHTLFTLEHNAICTALSKANPLWEDERLFAQARLINAAVMAKIHTVEWTPGILAHPTVKAGMNNNWNRIRKSKAQHHAAPYSLTEEFIAVYRMHPLMPDEFTFRSMKTGQMLQQRTLPEVTARGARKLMNEISFVDLLYSFGVSHPGAITLHNYPRFLQFLEREDGPTVDLASVDILRDRERGVPRYNTFRKLFHLDPVEKFEDLSDNKEWCEEIRRVYSGDINAVDLMVGMYAEPLIKGFGFSETAFRVFLLMASRRLQSDRFFTTDYNKGTYTDLGLKWIDDASMVKVLTRHFPDLMPLLSKQKNGFAPWPAA